ncbi:Crp/Fnr family transcriptional regulator [Actinocatenispora sera]|uniref:Crp/Fnr family transcriptional regulator n=1 Tax=Actinocatenispora sera TaxID=390989 RepID=UPI003406FC1C
MTRPVTGDTPTRLRAVPLFAGLDDARLRAVLADSAPRRYRPGQPLWHAGDAAGRLAILLAGRVAATTVTSAGRVLRFGEWAAPCALDKVAVIDAGGHTATFVAQTPCRVRLLPRERFLALVDTAPAVRRHVLQLLARQARDQQQRWVGGTGSAQARLAAWLLTEAATPTAPSQHVARAATPTAPRERAGQTGTPTGPREEEGRAGIPADDPGGRPAPGVVVALPGSQQALAELLGVTRVTVNRALARLRRDGLIAVDGGTVRILAPELLARRADN